jgi:gliding motility-associated-like protein
MLKKQFQYTKKLYLLLFLCFIGTSSTQVAFAQLINNGANIVIKQGASVNTSSRLENRSGGTITNDGILSIRGSFNHNTGTFTNNREVNLGGNLLSNASFVNSPNSIFRFNGNLQQMNSNTNLDFGNLIISGSGLPNNPQQVILNQNIVVRNQLILNGLGFINLNRKFIDLGNTGSLVGENNENRIRDGAQGGYIQVTGRTNPSDLGGLGVSLRTTDNLGTITVRRGHDLFRISTGNSIRRYFDITSSNAMTNNTTIIFQYFQAEVTQRSTSQLGLFGSQDAGRTWNETQSSNDEDGRVITAPIVAAAGQANRWTAFERNTSRLQATLISRVAGQLCDTEKLQLEATEIPNATYTWTGPNGFRITGRTPVVDFSTNLRSGNYVVTADIDGLKLTDSVAIRVSTGTDFNATLRNASCQGSRDGSITVTSKSGQLLSFRLGETGAPQLGVTVTFSNLGKGEYTVYAVDILGCERLQKFTINEQIQLNVDAGPDVGIIRGSSALLQASGATNYVWTPANTLSNPTIPNPIATPTETTIYSVTGTNAQGCSVTDEVTVTVVDGVIPDRVLSPNGDGVNDRWFIENILQFPSAEVVVFDRWGNTVFSTTNYQNTWEGTGINGVLPEATYYYVIKIDDANIFKGIVTILR